MESATVSHRFFRLPSGVTIPQTMRSIRPSWKVPPVGAHSHGMGDDGSNVIPVKVGRVYPSICGGVLYKSALVQDLFRQQLEILVMLK